MGNDLERIFFPYGSESLLIEEDLGRKIDNIYRHIGDDISKYIFSNRLLFSITSDLTYMRNIISNTTDAGKKLECKLMSIKDRKVFVYGAGVRGRRLVNMYPEVNWGGYFDVKKTGIVDNLNILDKHEINKHINDYVVISNYYDAKDIYGELEKIGFDNNKIICLKEYDSAESKKMYFDNRCLRDQKNAGVFVDVGCYDATDSLAFLNWSESDNKFIYAFEPDVHNLEQCKEKIGDTKNIKLINKGCYSHKRGMLIQSDKAGSNFLSGDASGDIIQLTDLDSELKDARIDYIKMDIEGLEEEALLGAKSIIKTNHPILAISVYHKRSDIIRIADIVLDVDPSYRLKFGHYSANCMDTVLYAI